MPVHIAIPEPTSPRSVPDSAAYNLRSLPQYLHALYSAGATPIPIPLHESPQRVAKILSTCHGILLPGSPADIDPQKYGESAIPQCEAPDPDRAAMDELLMQDAFHLQKPILAICQGLQALNTWRGGSLIQDIPTQVSSPSGSAVNHSPGRTVSNAHPIAITPGTRLALVANSCDPEDQAGVPRISLLRPGNHKSTGRVLPVSIPEAPNDRSTSLGWQTGVPNDRSTSLGWHVNSSHHQSIRIPGDNLVVSAVSPQDNVVEAVESASGNHFVLAVQWHPERTYDQSALSRAIFSAFVHACEAWAPGRIEESVLHA
jgi:putative glutamine amidotransferase